MPRCVSEPITHEEEGVREILGFLNLFSFYFSSTCQIMRGNGLKLLEFWPNSSYFALFSFFLHGLEKKNLNKNLKIIIIRSQSRYRSTLKILYFLVETTVQLLKEIEDKLLPQGQLNLYQDENLALKNMCVISDIRILI